MNIITVSNVSNVFVQLIAQLNVPHTQSYSSRYYNEHPYKNTLFGLSKMLLAYDVNNVGLRLNDKDEILSLEIPFVAQLNKDFVIVREMTSDRMAYWSQGKSVELTLEEFKEAWSGAVLLPEASEHSIEPDYKKHRKQELFDRVERYALLCVMVLGGVLSYVEHKVFLSPGYNVALGINLVGIYVGYLLLLKQLHIKNESVDKLCSLFKKGDCNSVLESSAAKFLGFIGWSEVGFGYFLSNLWIILFAPQLISYMALINICALPYSFWSVWYQKFKAKQWCAMCLVVQVLLWCVFVSNLLGGFIRLPAFTWIEVLEVGTIYLIPFLTTSLLLPVVAIGRKSQKLTQEISSLRMRSDVFLSLLKQSSYCEADKSTSKIQFGNPDAKLLLTILTNPHCDPCGRMHARVNKLLENCGENICVQYVFSSFNKEVESSAQKLIAIYLNGDKMQTARAFNEWFEGEKFNRKDFFKKYPYDMESPEVTMEYQKHLQWKKKNALHFTPLIFINGYEMPKGYQIEDMVYFSDLIVQP